MQAHATLRDRVLFIAAFALALALSWPGIEARAESDLAPSSRELTSLGAAPAPSARAQAPSSDSCAAADPALVARDYDAQRAMMQRLAQAMQAEDAGGFQALDGRGYGYFADRNPAIELARLQREAQLQARAQAAEAAQPK
jgi:hypothetical protein